MRKILSFLKWIWKESGVVVGNLAVLLLIVAALVYSCEAEASTNGPYIEFGTDYDPEPLYFINGGHNRTEASHWLGELNFGWEWDFNSYFNDGDQLKLVLKIHGHVSDIMKSGEDDIISQNGIRGLRVRYRFW